MVAPRHEVGPMNGRGTRPDGNSTLRDRTAERVVIVLTDLARVDIPPGRDLDRVAGTHRGRGTCRDGMGRGSRASYRRQTSKPRGSQYGYDHSDENDAPLQRASRPVQLFQLLGAATSPE
jgi:hypothetical protein